MSFPEDFQRKRYLVAKELSVNVGESFGVKTAMLMSAVTLVACPASLGAQSVQTVGANQVIIHSPALPFPRSPRPSGRLPFLLLLCTYCAHGTLLVGLADRWENPGSVSRGLGLSWRSWSRFQKE